MPTQNLPTASAAQPAASAPAPKPTRRDQLILLTQSLLGKYDELFEQGLRLSELKESAQTSLEDKEVILQVTLRMRRPTAHQAAAAPNKAAPPQEESPSASQDQPPACQKCGAQISQTQATRTHTLWHKWLCEACQKEKRKKLDQRNAIDLKKLFGIKADADRYALYRAIAGKNTLTQGSDLSDEEALHINHLILHQKERLSEIIASALPSAAAAVPVTENDIAQAMQAEERDEPVGFGDWYMVWENGAPYASGHKVSSLPSNAQVRPDFQYVAFTVDPRDSKINAFYVDALSPENAVELFQGFAAATQSKRPVP